MNQKKYSIVALSCAGLLVVSGIIFYYYKNNTRQRNDLIHFDLQKTVGVKNIIPVAIIGSGPAGLSAALYASRLGFYSVVFQGKNPGGQLVGTSYVENWPGISKMMGADIIMGLQKQAQQFGTIISADSIEKVDFSVWPYVLITEEKNQVQALTVIIATGSSARLLEVPGEKEFWGKGVTTCAICDAPFYKNKDVVVIGGGDSAVEEVMQLAPHARSVKLFVRGPALRASFAMQEHLKNIKQLEIFYNTKIKEIKGDEHHVRSIDYVKDGVTASMPIDGVFLAIGHEPNSLIFKDKLERTPAGYITVIPGTQKTSIPGVYVAGDVADDRYRQAGVAAGDGIKAALDAASFLHAHGYNETYAQSIENYVYEPADSEKQPLANIETLTELDALIAQATTPLLVDFYTPYCPSCMQMLPALESVASQHHDDITIVKVDGSKFPEVMDRWDVATVPHILVFKDGALVARSKEVMNKRELNTFIKQFLTQ